MTSDPLLDAYLAGLFDGEGCVVISIVPPTPGGRKHWHFTVGAYLAMTDEAPVRMMHARYGGHLRIKVHQNARYKKQYVWDVTGRPAIPVLEALSRNCVAKRRRARAALKIARSIDPRRRPVSAARLKFRAKLAKVVVRETASEKGAALLARLELYLAARARAGNRRAVTVGGVEYPSISAASRALGVSDPTIRSRYGDQWNH